MTEQEITTYITDTFDKVFVQVANGDSFFFYDAERNFPFATLVTHDDGYDNAANLDREGVFRLNVGVSKATFLNLFGAKVPRHRAEGADTPAYDYTALNHIMPHPVYGKMYWVGILNPTAETFTNQVVPLLQEAHQSAVNKIYRRSEDNEHEA